MIKLTINPKLDPIFRIFKKNILNSNEPEDELSEKNIPFSGKKRNLNYSFDETPSYWKFYATLFLSLVTLIVVCFAVFYISLSDKTKRNEIIAAEGVADVAMALTYAQVNHINPLTQNWSNPEFLKNNFSAIVPPEYPFLANLDSHGKFNNCPYLLRIYTNNDFSSFLVVALPEPSLLQWLIPKNAIFVHSSTMELRKIEDLRSLNRLLVNPNTLDGSNGTEITNLVKNGHLIPLASLAHETKDAGFLPPKALGLRRPGSENLIHNAPRYYQFTESYIKKALHLARTSENNRQELSRLQQEISQVFKLPNIVFYSSDGIESSIQAEKAFATFIPFGKFLNAYVIFNSEGKITGSRLVMEEDYNKMSTFLNDPLSSKTKDSSTEKSQERDLNHESIHPFAFELSILSSGRKQALKEIATKIQDLLDKEIEAYNPKFAEELADLAIQFQHKDLDEKEKISKVLTELYEEYSDLPLAQIMPHTKAAGLDQIIAEMLHRHSESIHEENLSEELLAKELQMIKRAKTFDELEESTTKAVNLLNLKFIPDPQQLIAFQNETKSLVLEKLEEFLLSSDYHLPKSELNLENRNKLSHILEISWITDPHETSFFLNEFDQLN